MPRKAFLARLDCGPGREPRCDGMHIEVATPVFQGQSVPVSYTGRDLRHAEGKPVEFTGQVVANGSVAPKPSLRLRRIGSGDVAEGGTATYQIGLEGGSTILWAPRPNTPPGITSYRDYGIPVNIDFVWNDGSRTSSGNPASVEMFLTGRNTTAPGTYNWRVSEEIPDNGSHCDSPLKMDLVEHEGGWYTINTVSGSGDITIVDGGDTHACGTSQAGTILPEVTVSASRASVREGSPIEVTLTRTGGGEAVTVGLSVSETGKMLSAVVSQAPLAENASSATFSLLTLDDETDEEDSVVTVAIAPDAERYDVGEPSSVEVTVEEEDDDGGDDGGRSAAEPVTAAFEAVPESHDGDSPFTFELRFSEEFPVGYRTLRDDAFEVTGGRVLAARRLAAPSNARWRIEVEPDSAADVVVTLPGNRACDAPGAICAEDGRRLSNSPSLRVEGPPAEPLTAAFEDMPAVHDGERFTFGLTFSEEPAVSFRALRDHAFEVGGGAVRMARRRRQGSNRGWTITVEPSGFGEVSIRLPQTGSCDAQGAICTGDSRPLSHALSATVRAPVGVGGSDARVTEAVGAVVAFAVTLSRAASGQVTVDYATSDGTAQAGVDYTAARGTRRASRRRRSRSACSTTRTTRGRRRSRWRCRTRRAGG